MKFKDVKQKISESGDYNDELDMFVSDVDGFISNEISKLKNIANTKIKPGTPIDEKYVKIKCAQAVTDVLTRMKKEFRI